ncbi:MAG: hypothetical protein K5753_03355 [Clostridia bacterium]|nr:hypothetical protein [Clostridia bacterium]
MKKISAKEVAISGVTAALAVIAVVLAHFVEPATVAFYALSSVALSLPLIAGSGRGAILSYVASAALSFLFVGYLSFLPFALMFGPYPILFYYLRKYLKKSILCLPIEVVFANASFFGCFFLMSLTLEDFPILDALPNYGKYLVLAFGLTLVFILFDFAYAGLYRMLERRFGNALASRR